MKLILLSGENNKYNKIWSKRVKELLKDKVDDILIYKYEFWKKPYKESIDLEKEIKVLLKTLPKDDEYIILAKNVGTILTLKGIYDKKLKPKQCIFLGIPIIWARINNFLIDKWIANYNTIPTLIFQKEEDPAMYYNELKTYLKEQNKTNIRVIKIPGRDMYYEDINRITDIIDRNVRNFKE